MKKFFLICCIMITTSRAYPRNQRKKIEPDTLVFVHVLFRHGHRTPDVTTIYPNDPYKNESYYPYGIGALTNEGKETEFKIGRQLRERYNKFLGTYTLNQVHLQASPIPRTKMSGELVLASLFPPIGIERWNNQLNWQPIDFEYNPENEDVLFLYYHNCQKYLQLCSQHLEDIVEKGEFDDYLDLVPYLSHYSGWNVTSPRFAFLTYASLKSEEEWGLQLPSWTDYVYPEPLQSIAIQYMSEIVKTEKLKQLSGGFLLRRIAEETASKLNGSDSMKDRKISLYAGHDFTVIALLSVLGVYTPHQPPFGAYVIIEVHKIGNIETVKVFYQDYTSRTPHHVPLPHCDDPCPFETFLELYSMYFATENMCKIKNQKEN